MVDGIPKTHAAKIIGQSTTYGEQEIKTPQPMGGGGNARMEFANLHSCRLGGKDLLLTDA